MRVKVINKSNNPLPRYVTEGAAGMDVRASLTSSIILEPGKRLLVPTGLFLEIEPGYECQVRPRSGLALKNGVSVCNSPGTVDEDYRGEIGIILINHSDTTFVINNGDRIAQLVFSKVERATLEESDKLSETDRGSGGFGHTKIN